MGGAGAVRVGVEEGGEVPATVSGERPDGVPSVRDQLPQLVGAVDASWEAAAHGDDGDRFVHGAPRGHCGFSGFGRPGVVGAEPVREGLRGGVVEHDGAGQRDAGDLDEAVAEFDGGHRVESDVPEGPSGFDGGGVGVPEHHCCLVPDQVEDDPGSVRLGEVGEVAGETGGLLGPLARWGGAGQLTEQAARSGRGEHRGEPGPVHVGEGHVRLVARRLPDERGDGLLGRHRAHPDPGEPFGVAVHLGQAGAAPRSPGHGGRDPTGGPTAAGEGVEVGVGRAVGGLLAAAPHARAGGDEDERLQRRALGELVEVGGAGDLGGEHLRDVGEAGLPDRATLPDARGVHDAGERLVRWHRGQDGGERVPVGDVTGGEGDLGAAITEFRGEVGRTVRVPAEENEVRGTGLGQSARDRRGDAAAAAGHQDTSARGPPTGVDGGRCGEEPSSEHTVGTDRDLVLPAGSGEDGDQPGPRPVVGGRRQVDQSAPARRVFQGRGTPEAPHQGAGWAFPPVVDGGGPQGRADTDVVQGEQERPGPGESSGDHGVVGVRVLVEREQ